MTVVLVVIGLAIGILVLIEMGLAWIDDGVEE